MSEGFHSAGSGGGERPNNPTASAAGNLPAGEGAARQGTPSAIATNSARPDLPVPDMSTPEGLVVARSALQRAIEIAGRQTLQSPEQAWTEERPQSAPAAAGGASVPAYYESTSGVDSQVLRISSPTTTGFISRRLVLKPPTLGPRGEDFTPPQAAPLQPTMPTWSNSPTYGGATSPQTPGPTPRMRTAIAAYGGYTLQDASTPKDTQNVPPPTPTIPSSRSVPTPATGTAATTYRFGGMPQHIKNAVRMIQPFYSDNTTVDKARAFWDAFVRATAGLDEPLRLSAFRECLKGKSGEEWWMYSRIEDFETLRIRFHNQFICLTPLQMIERLKNTKRSKGMSAEVWGDLIQGLGDEAHCYDPRMRYQYFLSGLRNEEWKTTLSTAMVNSIQQAEAVLLYKNMRIPLEDDADFADEVGSTSKTASAEGPLLAQMMQLLQANQNLILQQQKELAQPPRSPRRSNYAAAEYDAAAAYDNQGPPPPAPNYSPNTPANVPQSSSVLPEHIRLFSEAELDALEENALPLATPELEEYDKEIEERMFPLDEIELKKKVALNTARAREPTLEELSDLLQLPVEVLETREASPGEFSTPEYWPEWYQRTLAASNEAKRANRDFRKDAPSPGGVAAAEPLGTGEVECEERVASVRPAKALKTIIVSETEIANNICVTFSGATSPEDADDEGTPGLPFRLRSLVRSVTYALVMEEEVRSEVRCPQCHYPETYPPTPSSTSRFTPEERKNRARELVLELAGVLGDSVLDSVLTEINKGYSKEARLVRRKRLDRQRVCWCHRPANDGPDRPLPVRRVRFDHTSLSADRSEALGLNVPYVENEDDVLNYVCVVRDSSDPKPGLVEIPDDSNLEDPSEADANRPVPDGKRVICTVGVFEAISGGTIANMPAELRAPSRAWWTPGS
ncbi:hypothetical protein PR003_g22356 [Phytophthora rubi]|uniref:Retrotransposon gag domain-containing protein n=1 Tax=Phytophthora rubi TaxID=129364 RepID=A0A6A4D6F3_9STRA|nr:hypothetical protein PR003_g22356 [Phytophthora rubi]